MEMRILTGEGADKTWPLFKVMQVLSNNEPNGVQITDLPDMPWFSKVQVDKDVLQRLANFQLSMQSTTMTRLKQHKNRQNEKESRNSPKSIWETWATGRMGNRVSFVLFPQFTKSEK